MTFTRRSLIASGFSIPFLGLPRASRSEGWGRGDVGQALPYARSGITTGEIKAVYTRDGLAISGYDPVAYFTEGRPVPGSDRHRLRWHGAVWQFASEVNRRAFEMNPAVYAPQFGGYCAYTVANGYPMKAEPDVWTIHEGCLYLNFNASIRILWQRDMVHYIALARENWRSFDKS